VPKTRALAAATARRPAPELEEGDVTDD
jgi:hypothetical protein